MKTLVPMFAALLLAGCGVSEADVTVSVGPDSDQLTEELGTQVNSYVTARYDMRRCMAPICGGYWVKDLNRVHPYERYVSGFDFSAANLDEEAQALVAGGVGEVVLRGHLGPQEPQFKTRTFVVLEAWRGMPGVATAAGEFVYRVTPLDIQCFAAPCPSLQVKKVNYAATKNVHGVKTHRAALTPQVDQDWMTGRMERHDALVAASIVDGNTYAAGTEKILDASQVFVRLPNRNGPCPMMRLAQCEPGKIHSYSRSADLCILPAGCVTPGVCAAVVPDCPANYTLSSWSGGQFACPTWACDPSFIVPQD